MCCGKMVKIPNDKEKEMITTRQIEADNPKKEEKLKQATTKDIDTTPPMPKNLNPQKATQVSTRNIEDVADIAEKKRRDAIMAEKGIAVSYDGMADMETKEWFDAEDDKGFNLQYAIVEIDELLQGISRRELK